MDNILSLTLPTVVALSPVAETLRAPKTSVIKECVSMIMLGDVMMGYTPGKTGNNERPLIYCVDPRINLNTRVYTSSALEPPNPSQNLRSRYGRSEVL